MALTPMFEGEDGEGAKPPSSSPRKDKAPVNKTKRKKTMSEYADKGKWAEAEVDGWLSGKSAALRNFWYHRYPDARAARGALAAQPSDFEVSFRWGTSIYSDQGGRYSMKLEVKETKQVRRLPLEKIGQFGKLKMAWWSGHRCFVVIFRSALNDWTWLADYEIFQDEDAPPSFEMIRDRSYTSAASVMDAIHKQLTEDR